MIGRPRAIERGRKESCCNEAWFSGENLITAHPFVGVEMPSSPCPRAYFVEAKAEMKDDGDQQDPTINKIIQQKNSFCVFSLTMVIYSRTLYLGFLLVFLYGSIPFH